MQLTTGVIAVVVGLVLGAIIAVVWRPCLGAELPIDPLTTPRACVEVTSGANTAWVGLLLWPVALAVAGIAALRTIARATGPMAWVVVIVLVAVVLLANPLAEYALLNSWAQSWDEPPGTGALTAGAFVLSGGVLVATRMQRAREAIQ